VQAIRAAILRSKLNNIRTAPKGDQTVGDLAVRVESLELLCEGIEGEHYDQTSLELCEKCGWKALIPGDGCLVCARQKPVAWMYDFLSDNEVIRDWVTQSYDDIKRENGFNVRPLYTAPREWVGLTDEEMAELHREIKVRLMGTFKIEDIYRAIEAKLKEKNDVLRSV
jgi:hypothetical protein